MLQKSRPLVSHNTIATSQFPRSIWKVNGLSCRFDVCISSHSSIEFTRKIAQILRKRPTFKENVDLAIATLAFSKNGGRRRTKKSNTTTIACLHFYFLWSNYSYMDGQKRWNFSRENLAKREFTSKSMFNYDVSSVSNIMQNWKGDGQRIIPAFYSPFIFQLLNKW